MTERDALVPCPEDLRLTDAQRRTLETAMIPAWAVDALTLDFVSAAVGGDERRTIAVWRKCLSRAITGNWNDPSRRPKQQAATISGQPPARPVVPRAATDREPAPELPTAWERLQAEREAAGTAPVKTKAEQLAELKAIEAQEAAHGS